MANYVENKEMSNSKVKACMKQEIMDYIEQCVIERYGDARVSYVRKLYKLEMVRERLEDINKDFDE